MTDVTAPSAPGATPSSSAARLERAIGALRISSGRFRFTPRTLMFAGGAIAGLGVLVVLLGWIGAARTPYLQEQIPYLISGGLLGLALVFLGGFLYFAYWITEVVAEQRVQTATLVEALAALGGATAVAVVDQPAGDRRLVATPKGTMAHRADCSVVAGKRGLRTVTAKDDLEPCKLCNP